MAHPQEKRTQLRGLYVYQRLPMDAACAKAGVARGTANRWKKEAAAAGDDLDKARTAVALPVPARGVIPLADKQLRIESLQPHMHNGLIRLHSSQSTLINQFRHFPKADHDDGPDMVVVLWMLAVSGGLAAAAQSTNNGPERSAAERYGRTARRMFRRMR